MEREPTQRPWVPSAFPQVVAGGGGRGGGVFVGKAETLMPDGRVVTPPPTPENHPNEIYSISRGEGAYGFRGRGAQPQLAEKWLASTSALRLENGKKTTAMEIILRK